MGHLNVTVFSPKIDIVQKKVPHQIYKALKEKKVENFSIILLQYFYIQNNKKNQLIKRK